MQTLIFTDPSMIKIKYIEEIKNKRKNNFKDNVILFVVINFKNFTSGWIN